MSDRTYPDVCFVDYNVDAIVAEMTADYERIMKTTVHPGSPERLFLLWLADIVVQLKANIDIAAKENVPRFASGDKLESLTELLHDVSRLPASPATTTMRFTLSAEQRSAQLVPKGTRITTEDGNVTFITERDVYVLAGELTVDVSAKCQNVGVVGNGYTAGQINELVDIFPWYDHCENITTSSGGADAESDAELYQRMRESEDTYSTAGPTGAYVYWAKTANPAVVDAVANSPVPGEVKLYVLTESGVPDQEIIDAVYDTVTEDKVRPLTDHVEVLSPQPVTYSVDLTYILPTDSNRSAAEIEIAVDTAVDDFVAWQKARIGRDINPSKLYEFIMQTGVKRVEIRSPQFVRVADGSGDNFEAQVASLGVRKVLNGGYEDE